MTNTAAIGYAIMAAKRVNLTAEQIQKLDIIMCGLMDIKTEDEAEKEYYEYC